MTHSSYTEKKNMKVMNQAKPTENTFTQQILFTLHITLYQTVSEGKNADIY